MKKMFTLLVVVGFILTCAASDAQQEAEVVDGQLEVTGGDDSAHRVIKRNDEEFVVAVADGGSATVTDEKGTVVSIKYNSGNLEVRLPNGWGGWRSTVDAAVSYAVSLCFEYRSQFKDRGEAIEAIKEYVEAK